MFSSWCGPCALPFTKHGLCPFRAPILLILLNCSCISLCVRPLWYFLLLLPLLSTLDVFLRHSKLHETFLHFYIHSAFLRLFSGPNRVSVCFHCLFLSPQLFHWLSRSFASAGVLLGLFVNHEYGGHTIHRNVGLTPNYVTLQPWRPESSKTLMFSSSSTRDAISPESRINPWRQKASPKSQETPSGLHDFTSQNIVTVPGYFCKNFKRRISAPLVSVEKVSIVHTAAA